MPKRINDLVAVAPSAGADDYFAVDTIEGTKKIVGTYFMPKSDDKSFRNNFQTITGTVDTTTSFLLENAIKAGYLLQNIVFVNNEEVSRYINVGTTDGGIEIASDIEIPADGAVLVANYFDNFLTDTSIYISVGITSGTWAGTEDIDAYLMQEKVL